MGLRSVDCPIGNGELSRIPEEGSDVLCPEHMDRRTPSIVKMDGHTVAVAPGSLLQIDLGIEVVCRGQEMKGLGPIWEPAACSA